MASMGNLSCVAMKLTNEDSHSCHSCKSAVSRLDDIGRERRWWILVCAIRDSAIGVEDWSSFRSQIALPVHAQDGIHKASTESSCPASCHRGCRQRYLVMLPSTLHMQIAKVSHGSDDKTNGKKRHEKNSWSRIFISLWQTYSIHTGILSISGCNSGGLPGAWTVGKLTLYDSILLPTSQEWT